MKKPRFDKEASKILFRKMFTFMSFTLKVKDILTKVERIRLKFKKRKLMKDAKRDMLLQYWNIILDKIQARADKLKDKKTKKIL